MSVPSNTTATGAIELAESQRLLELEGIVAQGLDTFVQIGEALLEIRDSRLYRVGYRTFEDYCKTKWRMSKSFAFRKIAAIEVVKNLSPIGDKVPENESQVRPLTKLTREKQVEAWSKAVEKAGGKQPTAKQVKAAVDKVKSGEMSLDEAKAALPKEPDDIAAKSAKALDTYEDFFNAVNKAFHLGLIPAEEALATLENYKKFQRSVGHTFLKIVQSLVKNERCVAAAAALRPHIGEVVIAKVYGRTLRMKLVDVMTTDVRLLNSKRALLDVSADNVQLAK